MKIFFSAVALLLLLQSATSQAALEKHYASECEKALSPQLILNGLSVEEETKEIRKIIEKDLHFKNAVRLRFIQHQNKNPDISYGIRIFKDSRYPNFFLIDELNEKHLMHHELQTADDYAKYLKQFGLGFIFIGDFQSKSVALFDGIVINLKTGEPVMNISLKSRQTVSKEISVNEILDELEDRLSLGRGFKRYMNGPGWFAANAQVTLERRVLTSPFYYTWIRHARILADIFHIPLVDEPKNHNFRELKTVVDMRKSGYPYDFFLKPEIQNAIQKIVDSRIDHKLSLTLLWDSGRVIEFNKK